MNIENLASIPDCGIYGLVNPGSKRVFLYYSTNILGHLFRNIENIKFKRIGDSHLIRYRKNYRFEVITPLPQPRTSEDRIVQKLDLYSIEKRYSNLGYKVILPSNTPKFRFEVSLKSRFAHITLSIVNKNGDRFIIGIFDNKAECDAYQAYLEYPRFIICNNTLTKLYFNTLK